MTTIVKGEDYIIEGYPDSVVEVLATDMGGRWSVLVRYKYFQSSDDWCVGLTERTGEFSSNPRRLIPRPPRTVKRKVWINWYQGNQVMHLTRESADAWSNLGRIACTEVELDVPEGVKL